MTSLAKLLAGSNSILPTGNKFNAHWTVAYRVPKTRRPEDPKTRRPEDPKTRRPEDPKTRRRKTEDFSDRAEDGGPSAEARRTENRGSKT